MLRLKANKTALYKLVADYVDNLPPMRSGTEFIKYSRTPDYALNWITPEWNTANAFFSTCMGHSLLSIEIRDGETGKTASRTTYCEGCALAEHDAYICARWRLSYAVNELKKAIPLVRRTAAENRCMAGLWERRRNTTPPARWQSSG